jgi:hypothetical protein
MKAVTKTPFHRLSSLLHPPPYLRCTIFLTDSQMTRRSGRTFSRVNIAYFFPQRSVDRRTIGALQMAIPASSCRQSARVRVDADGTVGFEPRANPPDGRVKQPMGRPCQEENFYLSERSYRGAASTGRLLMASGAVRSHARPLVARRATGRLGPHHHLHAAGRDPDVREPPKGPRPAADPCGLEPAQDVRDSVLLVELGSVLAQAR